MSSKNKRQESKKHYIKGMLERTWEKNLFTKTWVSVREINKEWGSTAESSL